MRPRNTENRDLPPGVVRRKRKRKNGNVWVGYYYRDASGKEVPLGTDLAIAKQKWADLEAKAIPADVTTMKSIFDRYELKIIPGKSPRTQIDNKAEMANLRKVFDTAPIDAITPAMIAQYRDARTAKVRGNREIALLSHVFNMAREWGLTNNANPCASVRKNKEKPRDYYANDAVWNIVRAHAVDELRDAMDLAYLTGQRPADVLALTENQIIGNHLVLQQGKTSKKLRIVISVDGQPNTLGQLLAEIIRKNSVHSSSKLILTATGRPVTGRMMRLRWEEARLKAQNRAKDDGDLAFADLISKFQFRDIRPKAASEITDLDAASALLGHSKQEITQRVYRRLGAIAEPSR